MEIDKQKIYSTMPFLIICDILLFIILDLSQVFRQIFVESVFLFSKMIFQTRLGFGNQLSYECDFDCTNLQCI